MTDYPRSHVNVMTPPPPADRSPVFDDSPEVADARAAEYCNWREYVGLLQVQITQLQRENDRLVATNEQLRSAHSQAPRFPRVQVPPPRPIDYEAIAKAAAANTEAIEPVMVSPGTALTAMLAALRRLG